MNQIDFYVVTVNGVPYNVQVEYALQESYYRRRYSTAITEPPAQAPWVTAQRISHLPPR